MSIPSNEQRLLKILFEHSFQYSNKPIYKLSSGKLSSFYINCKAVSMTPSGLKLIGSVMFHRIKEHQVHAVGGLTMGADPIAMSISMASLASDHHINYFSVRTTPKGHGLNQYIVGPVKQGDRVVIVDDVVTTGNSTIKAIRSAREFGLVLVHVLALVDRQEGGGENIEKEDVSFDAVYKKEDFLKLPKLTENKGTIS